MSAYQAHHHYLAPMKFPLAIRLLILLLCAAHLQSIGQSVDDTDTRALMQANFLYQFANHNNWPAESKKGSFKIAVMGNQTLVEHLATKYGAQAVGLQPIEIINNVPPSQWTAIPQIVFIDKNKKQDWNAIQKIIKGKPVLVVTNWEGALTGGSCINFVVIKGAVRYELNETMLQQAHITPGVKILQWKVN